MFSVTYINTSNKRVTVYVEAGSVHKAIEEVSKHPDYDMLVVAGPTDN